MGYVHDPYFCQFIPPTVAYGTVATWAMGAGEVTGTLVYACDATDEAAVLHIPLIVPSHLPDGAGVAVKGAMLSSIEIDFEIKTAALDAMEAAIVKVKRGVDGAVAVVSEPTFTYDTGHDAAAERIDVDQHKMTLTLDEAVYVEDDEYYYVKLTIDKAATSIFQLLGAFAKFGLRA